MDKLNVLVADDTIVYRKVIADAVEATGMARVERSASNGAIALEWLKQLNNIDVVLLDVFMPEMDGIDTLKAVKSSFPDVEVIMISGGGSNSAEVTIEALKQGALDFILKPSESSPDKNIEKIKSQLQVLFTQIKIKKCSAITNAGSSRTAENKVLSPVPQTNNSLNHVRQDIRKSVQLSRVDLVLIASSTGGPAALEVLCSGMPSGFNKPVLVVQHMPPDFTKVLAQTLDKKCGMSVFEAKEGDQVRPGNIMIAPGGLHMTVDVVNNSRFIRLENTPHVNGVRPAADVLFKTVAKAYEGCGILAVVLTGMGNDGMHGISEIKNVCNCYCITQSEKTCVVYGMPRSVYEAGLSDEALDLSDIPRRIVQLASK